MSGIVDGITCLEWQVLGRQRRMTLTEEHRDLFTVDKSYYLAHCIASDLRMGAGIAVAMQKKFGLRGKISKSGESAESPTCILSGRVFNLITKKRSSEKPTYLSLESSLSRMRKIVVEKDIKKIAIPEIGCGLDRLQWGRVREIIRTVFRDVDVEIRVCVWK